MKAFIHSISYYLPEQKLTNQELIDFFPDWTVNKISEKIGISNRYLSGKDEFASDLAVEAAEKLFDEHSIDRNIIDMIILCTQSPDYFLPTTACIVQDRLRIPTTAGAFDFNLGCSGYVYGLAMAKGFIVAGISKNVLLITSEIYSKHIHPNDKGNRTIFGDGASATLVSTSGFAEIKEFSLGTDGSGAENLIVKQGGMRFPKKSDQTFEDEFSNVCWPGCLYMNGAAIFNFTLESVPLLVQNTLITNNLEKINIDWYIFHQANKFMLTHLMKKIGIEKEKFLMYMEDVGNTVSSTIPIVAKEFRDKSTFSSKQNILLAGFGVGYSWGGCVIQIV